MEGNRIINYNPADYKAVQDEASIKTKEELESFYVNTKDRKYMHPCVAILIGVILIGVFFALIWVAIESGKSDAKFDIGKVIEEVSYDICPLLGDDYVSIEFFESSYRTNKIDCRKQG